jgi:hypothetical protein
MNNLAGCLGREDHGTAKESRAKSSAEFGLGKVTWREGNGLALPHAKTDREMQDSVTPTLNANPEKDAGHFLPGSPSLGGSTLKESDNPTHLAGIPEGVRTSVAPRLGEYDARRLRGQREIIRDVMLSAANCETWLTLGELRAITRYGEASISAQLRHLRKSENGGYEVVKRHREGASPERPGTDGRGECVWEYRISRETCRQEPAMSDARQAARSDAGFRCKWDAPACDKRRGW